MDAARSLLGQHTVTEASPDNPDPDAAVALGGSGADPGATAPDAALHGRHSLREGGAAGAAGSGEPVDRAAVLRAVGEAAAAELVRTACRTESGAVGFAVVRAAVGAAASAEGLELLPDSAVGIPAAIGVSAGGFWAAGAGWEAGVVGEVEAPVVFRLVDVEGMGPATRTARRAGGGGAGRWAFREGGEMASSAERDAAGGVAGRVVAVFRRCVGLPLPLLPRRQPAQAVASPADARIGGVAAESVWMDAGRGCSVAVLFVDAGVPITPALWRGGQAKRG